VSSRGKNQGDKPRKEEIVKGVRGFKIASKSEGFEHWCGLEKPALELGRLVPPNGEVEVLDPVQLT
jgi:hypothetical protein